MEGYLQTAVKRIQKAKTEKKLAKIVNDIFKQGILAGIKEVEKLWLKA